jgi:hypothetical protein
MKAKGKSWQCTNLTGGLILFCVRPLILTFSPEGEKELLSGCSDQFRPLPASKTWRSNFKIRAFPKSSGVRQASFLPFSFFLFPFEFSHASSF